MGTCCASRTDMSGKTKAAGGKKTSGPTSLDGKSTAGKGAVNFNPMDAIRNTVMQLLQDSK